MTTQIAMETIEFPDSSGAEASFRDDLYYFCMFLSSRKVRSGSQRALYDCDVVEMERLLLGAVDLLSQIGVGRSSLHGLADLLTRRNLELLLHLVPRDFSAADQKKLLLLLYAVSREWLHLQPWHLPDAPRPCTRRDAGSSSTTLDEK